MKNLKAKYFLILLLSVVLNINELIACTSAIITGKITPDGRPLLWKHRDTGEDNNRIQFFKGEKFNFIALVNSPDSTGIAWTGTNSAGFSIMNTASYNLKDDNIKEMDQEGSLMYKALSVCKNLADFEKLLKNLPKPLRVEANFGVIDAEGGAAYYEVNNTKFVKVDANDPKIAPQGYLVYTNFSYTGRFDEGMGYIRQQNAIDIISKRVMYGDLTPSWIFNNLSRSFYHSVLGVDLKKEEFSPEKGSGWYIDQDFIPRKSSVASIVIQGVKPGEDPSQTIMWTMLGYPPAGIAVPLWVEGGETLPKVLTSSNESKNAYACTKAVALKNKTFPIKRGNGNKYMNFILIYNSGGKGYMQRLKPFENEIHKLFTPFIRDTRTNGVNKEELYKLYDKSDSLIIKAYSSIQF